jgi:hypothetical protein
LIPTYQEIAKINREAELLENEVNELLKQRGTGLDAIDCLLDSKALEIASYNQRIYILRILAQIGRIEIERGERKTIFLNRNTDELITLYRVMILYLRRIEFDFPDEYVNEIAGYIITEKISAIAIVGIIDSARSIILKNKVRKGVIKILGDMAS